MRNARTLTALAALVALSACAAPVGTIRGADYAIHVVEDAGKKCAEVWSYFPGVQPMGLMGCAIYRAEGWEGDMQVGQLFLPAEHKCAAFAAKLTWVVQWEEGRCRDHFMD